MNLEQLCSDLGISMTVRQAWGDNVRVTLKRVDYGQRRQLTTTHRGNKTPTVADIMRDLLHDTAGARAAFNPDGGVGYGEWARCVLIAEQVVRFAGNDFEELMGARRQARPQSPPAEP